MRFAISEHPNSHCWYIKHRSFCECFKEFGDEPIENLYWRMADNIEPFNNDELQDCLYYAMKAGYKEYIYKEYACAQDERLDLYNRLFKQMFIDDEDNIDRLINCIGDEESLNDSFICNLVFELGSTASGDMSMIRDKINMKILAFIDEQHPPLTETSLHLYTGIAAFSAGRIQMRNGDLPGARNNFERSVKEWQSIIELTNHKEWNEMLQTAKDALEGVKEAEQKKVGFHEFENIIEAIEELAVDEDELIEFCNKRRTEADNLIKIDNTEEAIVFYDEIIMIMGYLAGAHYQSVNLKEFLYLRIRSTYEKAKILYNEDKYQEACMILEDDLIYMDNMITHYANVPNVIDKIIIYYHLLAKVCAITEREVDSCIDQMLHVITMSDHLDVLRNVKIENAGLLVQLSHIMMQTGNTTQARRLAEESIERFKQLIPKDYEGIHHYALAYGISALTMINEDNDKADNVLIKSKITTEISMLELMKSMHKDVRSMLDLGIAYSHMATFYCSIKDYEREVVYIIKKVDLLFEAFQLRIGGQESEYTLEIIVNSLNFTADRVFSIVMGLEQQACVNLLAHLANIYNEILLTPYRENMEAINYYNAMAIQLFDMLHDQSPEYAEGYIISKLMQLHELLKEYGLDPPIVDDFKRTYAKYSDFRVKYIELLKDDFDNYRLLLDKINKCLNEQLNEKND